MPDLAVAAIQMDAQLWPLPAGRSVGAGIPAWQFLFDDSLIVLGRRLRRRRAKADEQLKSYQSNQGRELDV